MSFEAARQLSNDVVASISTIGTPKVHSPAVVVRTVSTTSAWPCHCRLLRHGWSGADSESLRHVRTSIPSWNICRFPIALGLEKSALSTVKVRTSGSVTLAGAASVWTCRWAKVNVLGGGIVVEVSTILSAPGAGAA